MLYLEGTKNLSGDVIHAQFLKLAAKGNYTDFPDTGVPSMANSMMLADPMTKSGSRPIGDSRKLNAEDYNLFRGVFNGVIFAHQTIPAGPRKVPDFNLTAMLKKEGVRMLPGLWTLDAPFLACSHHRRAPRRN